MILWTIQPKEIYDMLMTDGFYRCDAKKIGKEGKKGLQ